MSSCYDQDKTNGDWLPAFVAYRLVKERNGHGAAVAIATRANAGLLRTWATLLRAERHILGGQKQTVAHREVEVPQQFWWARGDAGLEQNWQAGDFSTWINKAFFMEAFGVKFHRADIERMLAPAMTEPLGALPDPCDSIVPDSQSQGIAKKGRSRNLTHDHPYAAAKTVLELLALSKSERARLTGPSVGKTMESHYKASSDSGSSPHADNLDEYGDSVLRPLREYWRAR